MLFPTFKALQRGSSEAGRQVQKPFLWPVTYIWTQPGEQQPRLLHAKHSTPGRVNHSTSGLLPHSHYLRRVPEVWTQLCGAEPISFTAVMKQLQSTLRSCLVQILYKGHIHTEKSNVAWLVPVKVSCLIWLRRWFPNQAILGCPVNWTTFQILFSLIPLPPSKKT